MAEIAAVSVNYTEGSLVDNLDIVVADVKAYCADYENMVITEENLKDGSEAIANIRKVKKQIDDVRKQIKKTWNDPYVKWEQRLKEGIFSVCDSTVDVIQEKMQDYEDKRVAERKSVIKKLYASSIESHQEAIGYISLDAIGNTATGQKQGARIFFDKWLLKSYEIPQIRDDIEQEVSSTENDVKQIKAMGSKYEEDALKIYAITRNFGDAVNRIRQMEEQEKRIIEEERRRRETEEREKERQRIIEEEYQKKLVEEAEEKAARARAEKASAEEYAAKVEQERRIAEENSLKAPDTSFTWEDEEKEFDVIVRVPESIKNKLVDICHRNGYRYKFKEV